METFKVTVREHEEYGELGLVIDTGRGYFEPAMGGIQCAHDILEHPAKPHPNGYIDELMALGGVLAGRIKSGWRAPYGRMADFDDIVSDISRLIECGHYNNELGNLPYRRRYIQDSDYMSELRGVVESGIKSGLEEFYGDDGESEIPQAKDGYCITTITSWIVEGYRAYEKRFQNHDNYKISVRLFNIIAEVCDTLIKDSEEYMEAKLHVDFNKCNAWIEDAQYY
jgi:hypothetical protein